MQRENGRLGRNEKSLFQYKLVLKVLKTLRQTDEKSQKNYLNLLHLQYVYVYSI